jgi:hypothetical protein
MNEKIVEKIFYTGKIVTLIILFTACSRNYPACLQKELAGHWQLKGNTKDISGNERHAILNGDVDFNVAGPGGNAGTAAGFNGLNAWLEIPADKSPRFGKEDFSFTVWINIGEELDDVPGDIVCKYDPVLHNGFQLGIKSNAVTTSQANALQLNFGIDNDQLSKWVDCGRPGNALCAFSMASYKGTLYAGTCEAGKDESGHVYRYDDAKLWINCGSPDKSNSVMALAVFNGKLYAGTAKYRLAGSALPESENLNFGGSIFRYEGDKNWVRCGQLPAAEAIGGLIVYKGDLYASSLYRPAGFFRYNGDTTWIDCGTPGGKRVVALGVYNGYIYATSYDGGYVYRYDGTSWADCGQLGSSTQTYSFAVYHGRLYAGTWPGGRVYRFEDINRWTDMGRLGNELEVMGMLVYNGRMIAGTLPLAEVYSFGGDTIWKKIARLDLTSGVKYRRAWTMAEHDGKVFCSTLPSGKIFSVEAGRNILSPDPVPSGWHHIAAVKSKNRLTLYLDGKKLVKSEPYKSGLFDLNNNEPLRIGFGNNDYFNGSMADLRLYNRSLNPGEIRFLSDSSHIYLSEKE